jgi:hypothetical protein
MVVYIVYKNDGEFSEIYKGFSKKEDAREFVDVMNKTTKNGWFHEELEVEE